MASHDEDTLPEETQGYKLSQPKQSLAEYQQMGKNNLQATQSITQLQFVHFPQHTELQSFTP